MGDFWFWLTEGLWHIADFKAYDHILFLAVLFAGLAPNDWKKALLLITGFTVGHSLTLALSVLSLVKAKMAIIEFLIPCTIIFAGGLNLYYLNRTRVIHPILNFSITCLFGLIHGLGFSTLLKSLLGKAHSIIFPLFSFNIGLELGQLLIILLLVLIGFLMINIFKFNEKSWRFFISSAAIGIASMMALERFPW